MVNNDGTQARPRALVMGRGASYPFIDLRVAVDRAKVFFEKEGRAGAPIAAAVDHWGYGEKSSGGKQTVSALLQYGLLRDEGSSDLRKVSISRLGLDVLMNTPGSNEYLVALKQSARSPRIFTEILTHYRDTGLPSDASLKHYLVADRELNVKAAELVIKNLRSTLKFALFDMTELQQVGNGSLSSVEIDGVEDDVSGLDQSSGSSQSPTPSRGGILPTSFTATDREWLSGPLRKGLTFRLLVGGEGDVGVKEIGNLIKMLEAMQSVLSDDQEL